MIRQLWTLSVHTRAFLRRYMPTNILLDAIRTRRGLKWGVPAMLLAVPYVLLANYCLTVIEDGGPSWLNLVILVALWNALKFTWIGPISLILLIGVRIQKTVARRRTRRQVEAPGPVEYAEASVGCRAP